jgi:hypothetical protein
MLKYNQSVWAVVVVVRQVVDVKHSSCVLVVRLQGTVVSLEASSLTPGLLWDEVVSTKTNKQDKKRQGCGRGTFVLEAPDPRFTKSRVFLMTCCWL